MRRIVTPEFVDQAEADSAHVEQSLRDLAWMNRYLGVTGGIMQRLTRLLNGSLPALVRVLDVGAGGGDVLATLGMWLVRRGLQFEGVALDRGRVTIGVAAERLAKPQAVGRLAPVCGDALALPFQDSRFDLTVCSTFLHHLDPDHAVYALREMARVSALGVVVSDLRRGPLGYAAAWLLANTVWRRHPFTRHDAPASMRAAYTMEEIRALARCAGLDVTVEPQAPFRWALSWRRPTI
jgi:ubiquinone/menaquinone biosynthesis C-methylase UbiE